MFVGENPTISSMYLKNLNFSVLSGTLLKVWLIVMIIITDLQFMNDYMKVMNKSLFNKHARISIFSGKIFSLK